MKKGFIFLLVGILFSTTLYSTEVTLGDLRAERDALISQLQRIRSKYEEKTATVDNAAKAVLEESYKEETRDLREQLREIKNIIIEYKQKRRNKLKKKRCRRCD